MLKLLQIPFCNLNQCNTFILLFWNFSWSCCCFLSFSPGNTTWTFTNLPPPDLSWLREPQIYTNESNAPLHAQVHVFACENGYAGVHTLHSNVLIPVQLCILMYSSTHPLIHISGLEQLLVYVCVVSRCVQCSYTVHTDILTTNRVSSHTQMQTHIHSDTHMIMHAYKHNMHMSSHRLHGQSYTHKHA